MQAKEAAYTGTFEKGIAEVQQRDSVNNKLFLEDAGLFGDIVKWRVAASGIILREASNWLCRNRTPVTKGFHLAYWAKAAVELKQMPMFSPKAYRMCICLSGDPYGPS